MGLKSRNPRFGCPRIARIISRRFGVDIDKHLVRRVLIKHYRPRGGDGPSWLSFIGHARDSLWSVDLFRCESIVLQSYWVLVVMDQFTRRIIGLGVHHGDVDGANLCRMFNEATRGQGTPRHLSADHDPLFEAHRWQAHLRVVLAPFTVGDGTHPVVKEALTAHFGSGAPFGLEVSAAQRLSATHQQRTAQAPVDAGVLPDIITDVADGWAGSGTTVVSERMRAE